MNTIISKTHEWVNELEAKLIKERKMKKVYLAGPDVFRKNAVVFLQRLKDLCTQYDFIGLSPLDNEVNPTAKHVAASIFVGNLDLIDECDIIIANLDPFRGPNIDDGTAFEIGYGYAKGKQIYGYTLYNETSLEKLTTTYDCGYSVYTEVENFGYCRNLMLVWSIYASGGKILRTFDDCLKDVSSNT
jgi:nucleoside 2-deoxyribosyltransferase